MHFLSTYIDSNRDTTGWNGLRNIRPIIWFLYVTNITREHLRNFINNS